MSSTCMCAWVRVCSLVFHTLQCLTGKVMFIHNLDETDFMQLSRVYYCLHTLTNSCTHVASYVDTV